MISVAKENFSIRQICDSGQCFRLRKLNQPAHETGSIKKEEGRWKEPKEAAEAERYGLTAFGRFLEIEERQNEITFHCEEEEFEQIWKGYFDLEEDYGKIIALIDEKDDYLLRAAAFGSGIRILRQDLWEMIVSFIISQQNNIKRIRKCIDYLCERYGEKRKTQSGIVYYDFPTPKALSDVSMEDLYACNLGYRSRYIHETAVSIASGQVDLKALRAMAYEEAKTELMKLHGVGVKVAECICLFALHQTQAFPVDTHIHKVLAKQYPEGFPVQRYKGYEGTLQQYIFYYDIMSVSEESMLAYSTNGEWRS